MLENNLLYDSWKSVTYYITCPTITSFIIMIVWYRLQWRFQRGPIEEVSQDTCNQLHDAFCCGYFFHYDLFLSHINAGKCWSKNSFQDVIKFWKWTWWRNVVCLILKILFELLKRIQQGLEVCIINQTYWHTCTCTNVHVCPSSTDGMETSDSAAARGLVPMYMM